MITRVSPGRWPSLSFTHDSGGGVIQPPPSGAPPDGLYFMSNEVPDSRSVLTDDFRRGNWYVVDGDTPPPYHTTPPGWGGTIFANPITPAGAIRNLQALGKKPLFTSSNYVATTGVIGVGANARNSAWHNLSGAGSGGYNELYVRCYMYYVEANFYGAGSPSANYLFGAQKNLELNRWNDDGGIFWGGWGLNSASGITQGTGQLRFYPNHNPAWPNYIDMSPRLDMAPGHWYYFEFRVKLNSVGNADGIMQAWLNDGGANGDFSGQTPTLRCNTTNIDWARTGSDTELFGVIWPENWSNADVGSTEHSLGEQFWANIHIKAGAGSMIGFV